MSDLLRSPVHNFLKSCTCHKFTSSQYGFVILTGILFSFLAQPTQAATLYFDPSNQEVYPGDTLSVAVRLDTDEGECVNVVDAVVNYGSEIVAVDVSLGNSIVPLWVEAPKIDKATRQVSFAGGIPNGYCGRIQGDPRLTNVIAEIIFQIPTLTISIGDNDNNTKIEFSPETSVYLNDGSGNEASLRKLDANFFVNERPANQISNTWADIIATDNTPPQEFSIELNSDPSIYSGRYFISFNTTDKQSGLDHYEVMEEPIEDFDLFGWGAVEAPWKETRSPYLLKDQTLNSTIRVKAVDKAGNEYIAVFIPEEALRGYSHRDLIESGLWLSGLTISIISLILLGYRWYRRRKSLNDVEITRTNTSDD